MMHKIVNPNFDDGIFAGITSLHQKNVTVLKSYSITILYKIIYKKKVGHFLEIDAVTVSLTRNPIRLQYLYSPYG